MEKIMNKFLKSALLISAVCVLNSNQEANAQQNNIPPNGSIAPMGLFQANPQKPLDIWSEDGAPRPNDEATIRLGYRGDPNDPIYQGHMALLTERSLDYYTWNPLRGVGDFVINVFSPKKETQNITLANQTNKGNIFFSTANVNTPTDNIRLFIKFDGKVSVNETNPLQLFQVTRGAVLFEEEYNSGNVYTKATYPLSADEKNDLISSSNGSTRFLWIPGDRAIRAGRFYGNQTEYNTVGEFSVAIGDNLTADYASAVFGFKNIAGKFALSSGSVNQATGEHSVALGTYNNATAFASVALNYHNDAVGYMTLAGGKDCKASGTAAVALGLTNVAIGNASFALGSSTETSGENSFAMGFMNKALGSESFATGRLNKTNGVNSATFGYYNVANGDNSIATGDSSTATGAQSVSFGHRSEARGVNTIASGVSSIAIGAQSVALGYKTIASGVNSLTVGYDTRTAGTGAVSMGQGNDANGNYSFAFGSGCKTTGWNGFAFGDLAVANGYGSAFSFGVLDTAYGYNSYAFGFKNKTEGFHAIAMGANNKITTGADTSFAVGNANIISGYNSIALGSKNQVKGANSVALGGVNTIDSAYGNALGQNNTVTGKYGSAIGYYNTVKGYGSVAVNYANTTDNYFAFTAGKSNYAAGHTSMALGMQNKTAGYTTIAIGELNEAIGDHSVAIGTNNNTEAKYSNAFGTSGRVEPAFNGSMILSDGNFGAYKLADRPNQFNGYFTAEHGGYPYRFFVSPTLYSAIDQFGNYVIPSDSNKKMNLKNVDGSEILNRIKQVPVYTYNWKPYTMTDKDGIAKTVTIDDEYIGPMAQAFNRAFPEWNHKDDHINSTSMTHILFAGVKELANKVDNLPAANAEILKKLESLEKENLELKYRLDILEEKVNNIAKGTNNSATCFEDVMLEQNNPNPFGSVSQINYYIPSRLAGKCELVIADASGAKVFQTYQVNYDKASQITINGSSLDNGVYLYGILYDGKMIQSKKFMVIK